MLHSYYYRYKSGFTLIELLIVIAIIGILSALAVVALGKSRITARDVKRLADIKQIATALELYYSDNGNYPVIITPGNSLRSTDGLTTYMDKIPSNPTPRNDGSCSNVDYGYSYVAAINSYNISTCLGSPASNFNPGVVSYSPAGVFNCGQKIYDADNNEYDTVQIGGQCWMKQNLTIGTMISGSLSQSNDAAIEKYCYSNIGANCVTYGGLYQWQEAMALSASCISTDCSAQIQAPYHKGLCPTGWHIPTDAEFNTLEQYAVQVIGSSASQYVCNTATTNYQRCADNDGTNAGGVKGAGKSLKKIGQGTGNGAGDDLMGFSILLGGYRTVGGAFSGLSTTTGYSTFWTASQNSATTAWLRTFYGSYTTILRYNLNTKPTGYSVRCLKD